MKSKNMRTLLVLCKYSDAHKVCGFGVRSIF
jgi:hypothetical protein